MKLFSAFLIYIFLGNGALAINVGDKVVKGQTILGKPMPMDPSRPTFLKSSVAKEFLEEELPMIKQTPSSDFYIDTRKPGFEFDLVFLGKIRPITSKSTKLLEEFAVHYSKEVLVSEANFQFWLPIQDQLLEPFNNEIQNGNKFQTTVRYFGAYKDGDKFIPIYAMIGFIELI